MTPAAAGPDDSARAEAVRAEGIRLQYESMPNAYIASAVLATVVAAIYQQSMPQQIWVTWIGAMYLHVIGRRWLRQRFLKAMPPPQDMARWGRYAALGTLVSGVLWGVGTVIGFAHTQGIIEFLIVPLIILFSVAAAFSAIPYLPVYYAFFIPSTLPCIIIFLMGSDKLRFLTGVAYLCFMLMVTRFAHVMHQSFNTSTRLRFENADLVEALRTEKAAAEEANRAKSRFLAAASHDLRQPMHALSLFIESYPAANLPAYEAGIIANMRKSADAMESLFESLLDISRLDAGIVEVRPVVFEARHFIEQLYKEFEPLARERGLTLYLRVADHALFTDPVLLNRIVSNFLSNSIRHGAREGVLLAMRPRQGRLAIEVWDTGIGIAEGERAEIFREFYQAGNPERDRGKGLGLGLAIVDRLVRLMGVTLEMRSNPGVGSMFRVLVPLGECAPADARLVENAVVEPPPACYALFVIVIDDERDVRDATSLLLTSWGCSVVTASSADEINALLPGDARTPDLILADLRLRGGATGIDAIQVLRAQRGPAIPGVIITGDTQPARLKQVRDSGLPILHKPLNPAKLRALLSSLAAPAMPASPHPAHRPQAQKGRVPMP